MRKIQAVMLAFLLTILCVILPFSIPVQAESMDVWEDFTETEENCAYLIRHAASGKYLTVANATAEEGAKICLYTADGVADDNTWYIRDGVIVSAMDDRYCIGGKDTILYLTQTQTVNRLERNKRDGSFHISNPAREYFMVYDVVDGKLVYSEQGMARQKWYLEPVMNQRFGDVNRDHAVNVLDLYLLKQLLQEEIRLTVWQKAICDFNQDGAVTAADVAVMQDYLVQRNAENLSEEVTFPECTISPTAPELSIYELYGGRSSPLIWMNPSMSSVGVINIPIFLIAFPDCPFDTIISKQKAEQMVFGEANPEDPAYPRESVTAYYDRASGGRLRISGQVYQYTAKKSISYYETNRSELLKEVLTEVSEKEDLSIYDNNLNGQMDVAILCVPSSASDEKWWPSTYGDPSFSGDVTSGMVVFGNMSLIHPADFNTTLIHELGHVMGLPDYYKYNTPEDYEGFHGIAGCEPMDDMNGEYSAFSKLMLGWYDTFPQETSPVQIYGSSQGTKTFSIDSITRNGRCLLISKTGHVSDNYFGEYFLLEYVAPEGNAVNSGIGEGGIRIFHVDATIYRNYQSVYINGNYRDFLSNIFCYENYSPIYKGDDKQRVLRLVNDGGEFFTTGDVIDSTTAGFGWYDDNGAESVDTGLQITIGERKDGAYTVTVETK